MGVDADREKPKELPRNVQDHGVDGPKVNMGNTDRQDPKPKEQVKSGSSNLSSPSYLWQGLHAANPRGCRLG